MTNVEKFEQMRSEASRALFNEDNEKKYRNLNHQASLFAEANFTEADFDEWISKLYGHMKYDMIQWKNNVLQERAKKK